MFLYEYFLTISITKSQFRNKKICIAFNEPVVIMVIAVYLSGIKKFYYPPEVRSGKYWGLGVFLLQYFPLVTI